MKKVDPGKLIIPLVLPFKENEDVDYNALEAFCKEQVEASYCDAINIGGTASEFVTLTFAERLEVIKCVVSAVDGKKPVIAGTGCASTRHSVELTQLAQDAGIDMALVIGPYYQHTDQAGLLEHYRIVASETDLPIMLYNNPYYAGVNINPSTFAQLAQIGNIVAIKENAPMPTQISDFISAAPSDFMCYAGDDSKILTVLIQGAYGAYGGACPMIGHLVRAMMDAYFAGDIAKATELHLKINPFFKNVFGLREDPIPIMKEALNQLGKNVGICRKPLMSATEHEKKVVMENLKMLGLL